MRIVRHADLTAIAWKNNGGVTREIASRRESNAVVWRVSLANVDQSGPFSEFAGLARILTVVDGAGMDLIGASESFAAEPFQPVQFSGELALNGRLRGGPVRNVNLIFDPDLISASATLLSGSRSDSIQPSADRVCIFVCIDGTAAVGSQTLQWGDTCIAENRVPELTFALPEQSAGLLITVEPKD